MFEEIDAGAGRLDILVQTSNGLRCFVELKMCGGSSYSSTYAADGITQLEHYMNANKTKLGILLVFDGRVREHGKQMQIDSKQDKLIDQIFVDVRRGVKTNLRE